MPTPAPDACPSEPRLPESVVDSEDLPSVPKRPASFDNEAALRRYVGRVE